MNISLEELHFTNALNPQMKFPYPKNANADESTYKHFLNDFNNIETLVLE